MSCKCDVLILGLNAFTQLIFIVELFNPLNQLGGSNEIPLRFGEIWRFVVIILKKLVEKERRFGN